MFFERVVVCARRRRILRPLKLLVHEAMAN
jgi:hypothetical protein